jgi:hypothetical protein
LRISNEVDPDPDKTLDFDADTNPEKAPELTIKPSQ